MIHGSGDFAVLLPNPDAKARLQEHANKLDLQAAVAEAEIS